MYFEETVNNFKIFLSEIFIKTASFKFRLFKSKSIKHTKCKRSCFLL